MQATLGSPCPLDVGSCPGADTSLPLPRKVWLAMISFGPLSLPPATIKRGHPPAFWSPGPSPALRRVLCPRGLGPACDPASSPCLRPLPAGLRPPSFLPITADLPPGDRVGGGSSSLAPELDTNSMRVWFYWGSGTRLGHSSGVGRHGLLDPIQEGHQVNEDTGHVACATRGVAPRRDSLQHTVTDQRAPRVTLQCDDKRGRGRRAPLSAWGTPAPRPGFSDGSDPSQKEVGAIPARGQWLEF